GLYIRALDSTDARLLPGTEGGSAPFFSPNGEHVAFFAGGKLKRTSIKDGLPYEVCAVATPRGGSWGDDDSIVFGNGLKARLFVVPGSGGAAQPFTTLDAGRDEGDHRYPHVLPGAKGVLFTVTAKEVTQRIAVQRGGTNQHETIVADGENAQY